MRNKLVLLLAGLALAAACRLPAASFETIMMGKHEAHPTRILARVRPGATSMAGAYAAIASQGLEVRRTYHLVSGLLLLDVPPAAARSAVAVDKALLLQARMNALRKSGQFAYVEPDFIRYTGKLPTDSSFTQGLLWGLQNTGQKGGLPGTDINAVRAWDITTGSTNVVVAVIDTGVRYTHQDLVSQMWRNPGESGGGKENNGVDDDDNGFIDDVFGINSILTTGDPMDDGDHGSHVSGTIGASANNEAGHVGVAWDVRIMGLKFLGLLGGATADAITCVEYSVDKGARISNNSWGGGAFSIALRDAIRAAGDAGQLFIAAAGNSALNNDLIPSYPDSYDLDNIVSVAAISRFNVIADFSNYGSRNVDIGAPGVEIYSTWGTGDTIYSTIDGTSMAAPHVSGIAALLLAANPRASVAELRDRILFSAVPVPGLNGLCTTGGRADAYAALTLGADDVLEMSVNPPHGYVALAGSNVPVYVRVTDTFPVTTATVSATLSTGGTVEFANDGKGLDAASGDDIYSANVAIPLNVTSITLTVFASAPDKTNATKLVTYAVLPPPVNDHFTNAVKIPPQGGFLLANNNFATMEAGEPTHADADDAGHSLWWTFAPTNSGAYFVDLSGSTFDTVLGIYTGNQLASLVELTSVDDVESRQQGYLSFNATAGVTYRIAVAGMREDESGGIRMRVERNGGPDNIPPIVSVTVPAPGQAVSNAVFTLMGTAFDPVPNSSGVDEVFLRLNEERVTRTAIGSTNWNLPVRLREGFNNLAVTAVDFAGNISTQKVVQVLYVVAPPPNDFYVQAISLADTAGIETAETRGAIKEVGEPLHAGNEGGKSVWWKFSPPADGVLTLSTDGSDFDTLLGLYTGETVGTTTLVAGNDDESGVSRTSRIVQAVRAGVTYRIAVDGYGNSGGHARLNWSFATATLQVLTVNASSGGTAAPGSGPYQTGAQVQLSAVPDSGFTFDHWSVAGQSAFLNPLTIVVNSNLAASALFLPVVFTADFESGGLGNLPWVNRQWIAQNSNAASGNFAARSAPIGDLQSSSLSLLTSFRDGPASFSFRVSSEPNWDQFQFLVDGVILRQESGDSGWQTFKFDLTSGTHRLEWRYSKDAQGSQGQDAAFLDNLLLPLFPAADASSPAHLRPSNILGTQVIEVIGQTNQRYAVEFSTNLLNWQTLSTNVAVGGVFHFADPTFGTRPATFYRAVVR